MQWSLLSTWNLLLLRVILGKNITVKFQNRKTIRSQVVCILCQSFVRSGNFDALLSL